MNTMVMKRAFSTQAAMAAGVAFHTHQVVAAFQTKKAKNESQNSLPFSPCVMRFSNSSSGTKPMKANAATPHVGQAAVSSPPLINANSILRPLPSRVPCLCVVFIVNFQNFCKGSQFFGNTAYFTCDRTGTDEIYAYCSDDKSLTRLTNTRYGVNDPFLVDGSLAFSGLTPSGKLLMRSEERFRESVDFSKVASYPIADKLSAQERDLIANMEPATVPEVRPASFHVAENLLHVHSWLPFYYNYDGFSATETDFLYETSSLGAMGFFQSLTGTSGGLLGISFH